MGTLNSALQATLSTVCDLGRDEAIGALDVSPAKVAKGNVLLSKDLQLLA